MDNRESFERGGQSSDQDISVKVFDQLLASWARYDEAWDSKMIGSFEKFETTTGTVDDTFNEISVSIESLTGDQPGSNGEYVFQVCEGIGDATKPVALIAVDNELQVAFIDPEGAELRPQSQDNLDIILSLMSSNLMNETRGTEKLVRELKGENPNEITPAALRQATHKIGERAIETDVNAHKKQIKGLIGEILHTVEGFEGRTTSLVKPRTFQPGDCLEVPLYQSPTGERYTAALTELAYNENELYDNAEHNNRAFELAVWSHKDTQIENVNIQCQITISPFDEYNLAVVDGDIPQEGYRLIEEALSRMRIALAFQSEHGQLMWRRPIKSTADLANEIETLSPVYMQMIGGRPVSMWHPPFYE